MSVVTIDGIRYVPAESPREGGDWRTLLPAEKVRIIEAMGFVRTGSDHQPDCPYALAAGYRCNCVPPANEYAMPPDVARHLGQDWESRLARAKNRAER